MNDPRRDVYETPMCPPGCYGSPCVNGRHEHDEVAYAHNDAKFMLIAARLRTPENDPPLTFMRFAGIALMVNSERRSSSAVPLNWFEACSTCGETGACDCEPNLLAILAHEEGGSEWQ